LFREVLNTLVEDYYGKQQPFSYGMAELKTSFCFWQIKTTVLQLKSEKITSALPNCTSVFSIKRITLKCTAHVFEIAAEYYEKWRWLWD